jgi:hypothetical protein
MTINWIQDEHGNRAFIHEGWSVRICALENSGLFRDKGVNRIHVGPPRWEGNNEVDVYDKGISVGSGECGNEWGTDSFIIPWAVLEAIFEARKIVTQELERT